MFHVPGDKTLCGVLTSEDYFGLNASYNKSEF